MSSIDNTSYRNQAPPTLSVRVDAIPNALKEIPHWVCWKWVRRKDKWTKVPINAMTGDAASSTNPRTWSTFHFACRRYRQEALPGIGWVFHPDAGIVGVDLDKCRGGNRMEDWARDVLLSLSTYSELSPTATGVHAFAYGSVPSACKTPRIEVYGSGRFFTVTGHRFAGLPQEPQPAESGIAALLDQLGAIRTVEPPVVTWSDTPTAHPVDLRVRAARGRIRRDTLTLLDSTGPDRYPSASEADAAIAAGLASAGLSASEIASLLMDSVRWADMRQRKGAHAANYLRRTVEHATIFATPTSDAYTFAVGALEHARTGAQDEYVRSVSSIYGDRGHGDG